MSLRSQTVRRGATPILLIAGLMVIASQQGRGQDVWVAEPDPFDDPAAHATITLHSGVVVTSPSGTFPGLIVGDSGKYLTDYQESEGVSANGFRMGLDILVPIGIHFGLDLDFASQRSVIRYGTERLDSVRARVRMELQTFNVGVAAAWIPVVNRNAMESFGFRTLFLKAGFEFGFGPAANRVTALDPPDSVGNQVETVGSFEGSDAFRTAVLGKIMAGVSIGFGNHLEGRIEGGWEPQLNNIFSSQAIVANNLSVSHVLLNGGVSYRF